MKVYLGRSLKVTRAESWPVISRALTALTLAGMIALHACGSKSDSDGGGVMTVDASSLVQDPQLVSSLVNSSHGDAVSAAADQGTSGNKLGLMLSDTDNDRSSVDKSCARSADGKSAVVTVTSEINRSREKTAPNGRFTISAQRTGRGTSTRTWSRLDGSDMECNDAGTGAKVNFDNVPSLRLEVTFTRERTDVMTFTSTKVTRNSSKSLKSSGSRSITWTANSTQESGEYIRRKSVVIKDVTQTLSMTNKNGESFSTSLSINTAEASPLVVDVTRDASDVVKSKKFVSGEVVVKKDNDATMKTTYTDLVLDFNQGSCSITSGAAQIVITDSTGAVLKTLTLSGSNGDSSLKDSNGEEIEGFSLDPCDSEDIKL